MSLNHSFLTFLVYALCVLRITRVVTTDSLTQVPREWLRQRSHIEQVRTILELGNERTERRIGPKPGLAYAAFALFTCAWCVSFWVAVVVVIMGHEFSWWIYVCDVFALSSAAGIISERI